MSAIPPIVIDEEQFDTIIKEFLENIDDKGSLITGKPVVNTAITVADTHNMIMKTTDSDSIVTAIESANPFKQM